jgi:short-subunit dehydrogenase
MRRLEGRVVAITGAGGGIGRALAVAFARAGCAVALSDRSTEALEATRAALPPGTRVHVATVDVGDYDAMVAWRDAVVAALGGVDVVVNNAGITVFGTFEEHTHDEERRLLDVNLRGVLHGCRAFLPAMRARGGGQIVNLSSMAGYVGIPYQSLYCATKFAVHGLSQALRAELAPDGIGVTSVHPGTVRTGVLAHASSHDSGLSGRLGELMLRFGMSPDRVARRVVRAVRRNSGEVRMTLECHATWLAVRVSPWLVGVAMGLLARVGRRLRSEQGR